MPPYPNGHAKFHDLSYVPDDTVEPLFLISSYSIFQGMEGTLPGSLIDESIFICLKIMSIG
ncbi:hypothetical protein CAEBREN_28238 [Caenorhabditis brenneri]|uniref:Uncharacterized protein n=1 Tax=Caenorhabditis brenneri TaxID=135651 RepID=G0MVB9_CAEBE|nr:hypothetical protein CAEBREN_28238 [Caenorhabditis brenneri]